MAPAINFTSKGFFFNKKLSVLSLSLLFCMHVYACVYMHVHVCSCVYMCVLVHMCVVGTCVHVHLCLSVSFSFPFGVIVTEPGFPGFSRPMSCKDLFGVAGVRHPTRLFTWVPESHSGPMCVLQALYALSHLASPVIHFF